jgi:ligand-binding sensor domain-containing protein
MKILCLAVLLFLLNFLSQYLIAQPDLQFTRITSKDGLSGDIVYSILQDKQGFLWIGTHQGLNRYDGYHFVHYNYEPYDTNSI